MWRRWATLSNNSTLQDNGTKKNVYMTPPTAMDGFEQRRLVAFSDHGKMY